jgi:hypothetical protein
MANSLLTQIIQDGPRHATVKLTSVQDTSDVAQVTIVAPASYFPIPKSFRVMHIDYSITDQLAVHLLWTATTDLEMVPLAGRGRMSFQEFGGLTDNGAAGVTGGIDVKTTGWTSGTQVFTLILRLEKVGPDGVGVK